MDWARLMRGTSSMLNSVARARDGRVEGARRVERTQEADHHAPGLSTGLVGGVGGVDHGQDIGAGQKDRAIGGHGGAGLGVGLRPMRRRRCLRPTPR